MGKIQIRKTPKRRVRNPDTGEELAVDKVYLVEDSIFWRRRLQSRDVTLAAEKEKTPSPAHKPEPAKKEAVKDGGEVRGDIEGAKEPSSIPATALAPEPEPNDKDTQPAAKPEPVKKTSAKV